MFPHLSTKIFRLRHVISFVYYVRTPPNEGQRMKEYLIRWQAGQQYGRQWVKAGSVVEAKALIKKEIDNAGSWLKMEHIETR